MKITEALLAEHVVFHRGERIVFPLAERVLKAATLAELGQAWMEQRTLAALAASPANQSA